MPIIFYLQLNIYFLNISMLKFIYNSFFIFKYFIWNNKKNTKIIKLNINNVLMSQKKTNILLKSQISKYLGFFKLQSKLKNIFFYYFKDYRSNNSIKYKLNKLIKNTYIDKLYNNIKLFEANYNNNIKNVVIYKKLYKILQVERKLFKDCNNFKFNRVKRFKRKFTKLVSNKIKFPNYNNILSYSFFFFLNKFENVKYIKNFVNSNLNIFLNGNFIKNYKNIINKNKIIQIPLLVNNFFYYYIKKLYNYSILFNKLKIWLDRDLSNKNSLWKTRSYNYPKYVKFFFIQEGDYNSCFEIDLTLKLFVLIPLKIIKLNIYYFIHFNSYLLKLYKWRLKI